MKLKKYIEKYSSFKTRPKYWHFFLVFPTFARRGIKAVKEFNRFVRANNIQGDVGVSAVQDLPILELFIAAIEKDFWLLPSSIPLAVKNSRNPIARITIVTQERLVRKCQDVVKDLDLNIPIEVLPEEKQFSEEFRTTLRHTFKDRYGWALQQFLTVDFVLKSSYKGVLALNADTLIIEPQIWLTETKQILMVSSEFHAPYYEVLTQLGLKCKNPRFTFITHHMLFVPEKLQIVLNYLNIADTNVLLLRIIELIDGKKDKSICVEFELYAQGLVILFPDFIRMTRFSNLGVSAKGHNSELTINELVHSGSFLGYNSLSLHSWS